MNEDISSEEPLKILPELQEALENFVQKIYCYKGCVTTKDAQSIAALAIQSLSQENASIADAIYSWRWRHIDGDMTKKMTYQQAKQAFNDLILRCERLTAAGGEETPQTALTFPDKS